MLALCHINTGPYHQMEYIGPLGLCVIEMDSPPERCLDTGILGGSMTRSLRLDMDRKSRIVG